MIRANVSYTKNHLSALLTQVKAGETIEITDRDRPVARLVPIERSASGPRLQELARLGLVRLPVGEPLSSGDFRPIQITGETSASLVEALLEEREEGR